MSVPDYEWKIAKYEEGSAALLDKLKRGLWEPFAVTVKAGANIVWVRKRERR